MNPRMERLTYLLSLINTIDSLKELLKSSPDAANEIKALNEAAKILEKACEKLMERT